MTRGKVDPKGMYKSQQGAKPIYEKAMKVYPVRLPDNAAEIFKIFGGGNLSAGIRKAAELIREGKT